jgi:hypothetical protein
VVECLPGVLIPNTGEKRNLFFLKNIFLDFLKLHYGDIINFRILVTIIQVILIILYTLLKINSTF